MIGLLFTVSSDCQMMNNVSVLSIVLQLLTFSTVLILFTVLYRSIAMKVPVPQCQAGPALSIYGRTGIDIRNQQPYRPPSI